MVSGRGSAALFKLSAERWGRFTHDNRFERTSVKPWHGLELSAIPSAPIIVTPRRVERAGIRLELGAVRFDSGHGGRGIGGVHLNGHFRVRTF